MPAVQIPKLIALASVAVRVQWREADEYLDECTTNLMAVGGVLHLDILSLPMPATKSKGWTLRAVTPDTQFIHRCEGSVLLKCCRHLFVQSACKPYRSKACNRKLKPAWAIN